MSEKRQRQASRKRRADGLSGILRRRSYISLFNEQLPVNRAKSGIRAFIFSSANRTNFHNFSGSENFSLLQIGEFFNQLFLSEAGKIHFRTQKIIFQAWETFF
jgi:hypothetical protein